MLVFLFYCYCMLTTMCWIRVALVGLQVQIFILYRRAFFQFSIYIFRKFTYTVVVAYNCFARGIRKKQLQETNNYRRHRKKCFKNHVFRVTNVFVRVFWCITRMYGSISLFLMFLTILSTRFSVFLQNFRAISFRTKLQNS